MTDQTMENDSSGAGGNDSLSKLKRTACGLCRKRKLKCDGTRPMCATCARLGHECVYEEARKKSGPKRGYVKALEARLAQVETQLKGGGKDDSIMMIDGNGNMADGTPSNLLPDMPQLDFDAQMNYSARPQPGDPKATAPYFGAAPPLVNPGWDSGDPSDPMSAPWDMLPTGLEEPLPQVHVIQELTEIYFAKIHAYVPLIHRARFLMAMAMPPNLQPTVALRYAMWTLASETSDRHTSMSDIFYRRCRKYLELDEMRGFGESIVTVAHCQAWVLISLYEFKNMYFPRAWMSCGRAVRLAQMLGLHRVDGGSTECKETLPPPKDWIEKEERRRTFWMTFWEDRCASIGTGWPMSVEEQDIHTNLPASDEAFQCGRPSPTQSLTEALATSGSELSGFAGAVLLAAMLGRNLEHMHRTSPEDNEGDLNGKYWTRHRDIDNILLNLTMGMPEALRIPMGLPDPSVIFMNMCIHTSVICLHQSAMSRADKHHLTSSISAESKMRCITAALEIASVMRAIAHLDLSTMNPFMSFCLYVAARVFIQYLRARRNDARFQSSLSFVLSAMNAMKKKNALNEAFLAQLDVEMEACNLPRPKFATAAANTDNAYTRIHSKKGMPPPKPAGLSASLQYGEKPAQDPRHDPNNCNIANFVIRDDTVIDMSDSPITDSSGNSQYGNTLNSRLPPAHPYDYRIPDQNIGMSPQTLTPGSTDNSDLNPGTYSTSRHNSNTGQTPPVMNNTNNTNNQDKAFNYISQSTQSQPQMVGEFPKAPNWIGRPDQTDLSNMDLTFDLPTPDDFNSINKDIPNVEQYINDDMSLANFAQTTMPMRAMDGSMDPPISVATPDDWSMPSGTGMTPNFADLGGAQDWDSFMEGFTEWDPNAVAPELHGLPQSSGGGGEGMSGKKGDWMN